MQLLLLLEIILIIHFSPRVEFVSLLYKSCKDFLVGHDFLIKNLLKNKGKNISRSKILKNSIVLSFLTLRWKVKQSWSYWT